jgi:uncharacterized protein YbaR (Trm112 family)
MTANDPEFLNLLRCPLTGERLRAEETALVSERGNCVYPIREGVCVLLSEAAQPTAKPEKL